MAKDTAYYRMLIGGGHTYQEFVNGCPTLLIDSEPAFVVVRTSMGRLVAYYHFKCVPRDK